jgi:release factor glutamine methyltransferase
LKNVAEAIQWGALRLHDVADRPHFEAERLLAAILQSSQTALLAHPEWPLHASQVQIYADAVRRRAADEPLPYILGHAPFLGLDFTVTPDVLIPRPETELLVERALVRLRNTRLRDDAVCRVMDVGTGSGCITVGLAVSVLQDPSLAMPQFIASDLSRAALSVARTNGLRHGVGAYIDWIQADLLTPIAGPLDLILSNPPYIAAFEWDDLPPSVRREPRLALLAGPEGLDVLRRLLAQARRCLAAGGAVLVEIGAGQGDAARALARAAFQNAHISIHPDLAGRDRLLDVKLS